MKQYIVFKVSGEEYAILVGEALEIIKFEDATPVPGAPKYIAGIVNIRGKIIVLIDLSAKFNLGGRDTAAAHLIVIDYKDNPFGILVDEVMGVLKIPDDAIKKSPELLKSRIEGRYLRGVGIIDSRVIILLDPFALVADSDLLMARGIN